MANGKRGANGVLVTSHVAGVYRVGREHVVVHSMAATLVRDQIKTNKNVEQPNVQVRNNIVYHIICFVVVVILVVGVVVVQVVVL